MAERTRWHSLLAAQEGPTGTWSLVHAFDRVYGTIELRRVSANDLRYRVSFRGEVIGWSTTLRLACEWVHAEFPAQPTPERRTHRELGRDRSRSIARSAVTPPRCPPRRGSQAQDRGQLHPSVASSEVLGVTRRRVRSRIPAGPRSTVRSGSM